MTTSEKLKSKYEEMRTRERKMMREIDAIEKMMREIDAIEIPSKPFLVTLEKNRENCCRSCLVFGNVLLLLIQTSL